MPSAWPGQRPFTQTLKPRVNPKDLGGKSFAFSWSSLGKSEAFSGLDGKVLPKATLSGLDVLLRRRRLFGPTVLPLATPLEAKGFGVEADRQGKVRGA